MAGDGLFPMSMVLDESLHFLQENLLLAFWRFGSE
jgi:hypothetical protein